MPELSMVLDGSAEMPTGVSRRQPFQLIEACVQLDSHQDGTIELAPSSGLVLHVVGVDGITMDVHLCDARGTVDGPPRQGGPQAANYIFSSEGAPPCTLYPGSCFHAQPIIPSGVSWASDEMSSRASLSTDTDMLRRVHATFPTSTTGAGAVMHPGWGRHDYQWWAVDPPAWRPGMPRICMSVVPGVPCARMAIELSDDDCDVPGLAHLWLRHLPPSFLRRMACVSMQWAAAVSSLELWRADMDHSAYTHALLDLYDHEGGSDARRADSPSSTRSEHGDGSSDGDPSDDPRALTFSIACHDRRATMVLTRPPTSPL